LRRPWTCCSAGSDPLPHYRPHPLTPSPPPLPYSGCPRPPRPPRPPTTPSLTPSRTRLSTLSPSQAVPSCVRPETCPHPPPGTGPSPFLLPLSHWPQKTMPPASPPPISSTPALSNPCPSTLFHTKNPTVLRLLGSFEYDVCGRSLRWQPRSPPPLICALCLPTTDVSPPPSPHPLHSLPSGLPCPLLTSKPLDLSRVAHCHPPSSFHHPSLRCRLAL